MSVHIVLASDADKPVADEAVEVLEDLQVPYQVSVASTHRTPDKVAELVLESPADVFVAIAGLSAALPGTIAAHTNKPVIGVPVSGEVSLDAILSIVQLPPGCPVGCVGLDRGDNAALMAAQILALQDDEVSDRLDAYRARRHDETVASDEKIRSEYGGGPRV